MFAHLIAITLRGRELSSLDEPVFLPRPDGTLQAVSD